MVAKMTENRSECAMQRQVDELAEDYKNSGLGSGKPIVVGKPPNPFAPPTEIVSPSSRLRYCSTVAVASVVLLPVALVWYPTTWIMTQGLRFFFTASTGQRVGFQEARKVIAEHL